jgi:hypothetical protein
MIADGILEGPGFASMGDDNKRKRCPIEVHEQVGCCLELVGVRALLERATVRRVFEFATSGRNWITEPSHCWTEGEFSAWRPA